MAKYVNKFNNDVWLVEDISNVHIIDGIEFVRGVRVGQHEQKMIAKDSLIELLVSENSGGGNLLNG